MRLLPSESDQVYAQDYELWGLFRPARSSHSQMDSSMRSLKSLMYIQCIRHRSKDLLLSHTLTDENWKYLIAQLSSLFFRYTSIRDTHHSVPRHVIAIFSALWKKTNANQAGSIVKDDNKKKNVVRETIARKSSSLASFPVKASTPPHIRAERNQESLPDHLEVTIRDLWSRWELSLFYP